MMCTDTKEFYIPTYYFNLIVLAFFPIGIYFYLANAIAAPVELFVRFVYI